MNEEDILEDQLRWEYLQFEIRSKLIYQYYQVLANNIKLSNACVKKSKQERECSESEIKHGEENAENYKNNNDYLECERKPGSVIKTYKALY